MGLYTHKMLSQHNTLLGLGILTHHLIGYGLQLPRISETEPSLCLRHSKYAAISSTYFATPAIFNAVFCKVDLSSLFTSG